MKIKSLNNINVKKFEILFKEHYTKLCLFALKYTKNEKDAEEVVQDVFYKIWEKRSVINIKTSIKSYLYISVRNKCLQNINHKKIVRIHQNYIENQGNPRTDSPYENLIYEESIDIFNEALNTLPDRCIEIFKLSRFEGLRYKEIAKELAVSIKTVEANISKALKTFRNYFPEYAKN